MRLNISFGQTHNGNNWSRIGGWLDQCDYKRGDACLNLLKYQQWKQNWDNELTHINKSSLNILNLCYSCNSIGSWLWIKHISYNISNPLPSPSSPATTPSVPCISSIYLNSNKNNIKSRLWSKGVWCSHTIEISFIS